MEFDESRRAERVGHSILSSLVRQHRHEPGAFDCLRYRVLTGSLAASLATTDNLSVPIGQLAEQVEILVIDKHGTRADAIDANGVFLGDLGIVATTTLRRLRIRHFRALQF